MAIHSFARRQSGLSLIELIISIALGLLLVAGATQIFVVNSQSFRLQNNISEAQESGRLGLEILVADLRRAGIDSSRDPATMNIITAISGRNGSATTALVPGLVNSSDEVTISYRVPERVASMSDCEGNVIPAGGLVTNRYFVKLDSNPDVPALFCAGAGGPGAALIRGVESFQLQYGVMETPLSANPTPSDQKANGFVSPNRYVLGEAASGAQLRIASIRVGILVRSESGIQGLQAPAADIAVLDQTATKESLADVKIDGNYPVHRYFSATAAVRNETYATFQ